MADIQNSSQLLSYRGDPGLAFGTSGTPATGAEIGVLDVGNGQGYNQLAQYALLQKKDAYDAQKKEVDETYKRLRDLKLPTDKLLDNDREYIIKNDIDPITAYLKKYPNSINPRTKDEVNQNFELKKMLNNFDDDRAKGQTRYIYKPIADQNAANDPQNRDDMNAHFKPIWETPVAPIVPYQKLYVLDLDQFKGPQETISVGKEGSVLHTDNKLKTNTYTTYNNTIAALADTNNKLIQNAANDIYKAYRNAYAINEQNKQQALAQAAQITDPAAQAAAVQDINSKIQPYHIAEINTYNNRVSKLNALQKDKTKLLPLIDPTKPLSRDQVVLVNSIVKNVSDDINEYDEKTSGRYGIDSRAATALTKQGFSPTSAGVLINVLTTFNQAENVASLYQKGINGAKGFSKYNQEDQGEPVYFNNQEYPNQIVVKTDDNRIITQLPDGRYLEYTGDAKKGTWIEIKLPQLTVDKALLKETGGSTDKTYIDNNELVAEYTTPEGPNKENVSKQVRHTAMDYLKLISPDEATYKATIQELTDHGITNLNDKAQMQRAIQLLNSGSIDNKPSNDGAKTTTTQKTYTYNGKKFTAEQIAEAAKAWGISVDDYIKKYGIK